MGFATVLQWTLKASGACFGAIAIAIVIAPPAQAQYARAINGDTLEMNGNIYRLAGIDAPEAQQKCGVGDARWSCGENATAELARLLDGRTIECEALGRDRYDHVSAVCRWGAGARTDLAREMVRVGLARDWPRHAPDYSRAEMAARRDGRGIWNGAHMEPWRWHREEREGNTLDFDGDRIRLAGWRWLSSAWTEKCRNSAWGRLPQDKDDAECIMNQSLWSVATKVTLLCEPLELDPEAALEFKAVAEAVYKAAAPEFEAAYKATIEATVLEFEAMIEAIDEADFRKRMADDDQAAYHAGALEFEAAYKAAVFAYEADANARRAGAAYEAAYEAAYRPFYEAAYEAAAPEFNAAYRAAAEAAAETAAPEFKAAYEAARYLRVPHRTRMRLMEFDCEILVAALPGVLGALYAEELVSNYVEVPFFAARFETVGAPAE